MNSERNSSGNWRGIGGRCQCRTADSGANLKKTILLGALQRSMDDLFRTGNVIVLDGGLATELEQRGADLTGHLWSAK